MARTGVNVGDVERRENYDWGKHWADWLTTQLRQHNMTRTQFVDASPRKANGRPEIDATVLGRWLQGQRPTFDKAVMTADILNMDAAHVVKEAGYLASPEQPLVIEDGPAEHLVLEVNSDAEARAVADFLRIYRARE